MRDHPIAIPLGILRHLRDAVAARPGIVLIAIVLDLVVPAGFLWVKAITNPFVLLVALVVMAANLIAEFFFLRGRPTDTTSGHSHTS